MEQVGGKQWLSASIEGLKDHLSVIIIIKIDDNDFQQLLQRTKGDFDSFSHYYDEFIEFPTEVCIGAARTTEQSQRRVRSLVPLMVFNDRATYKDRHARISSWPGETIST